MEIDGRTRLAAILGAALMAAPLWVGRYLPLLDLPQHLALATVFARHGDPSWMLFPYYEPQPGELTPYWTHYVALGGLGRVMRVEAAARVLVTLYVLALPWAAMALARGLGRPPGLGLLAVPLALNGNLYYGFIAYCWGVVLLLLGLAMVARQMDDPRRGRAAALAVLAAVLFFTHVQPFAFLLLGAALLAPFGDAPAWKRALRAWPLAPATAALFLPWLYLATTPRPGAERYFPPLDAPNAAYHGLAQRWSGLASAVAGSYLDGTDDALLGLWAVAVIVCAARPRDPASVVALRRVLALALAALACYFTLPVSIQGQWNIAQRFAWLAALLLPLLVEPARWLPLGVLALAAVTSANAAWHHVRFDREAAPFDRALEAVPRGVRVLGLMYDPRGDVLAHWPYLHFEQYAVVRGGGMAAHSFSANPPLPVRLRVEARLPAPELWHPQDFVFETHGRYFDYFLVRDPAGRMDPLRGVDEAAEVFQGGAWRVYRASTAVDQSVTRRTPPPAPGR